MSKVTSNKDMNKIEVSFPSSNPTSCQLYGDLYLPSTLNEESLLLPIIVIAGSGVSSLLLCCVCRVVYLLQYIKYSRYIYLLPIAIDSQ